MIKHGTNFEKQNPFINQEYLTNTKASDKIKIKIQNMNIELCLTTKDKYEFKYTQIFNTKQGSKERFNSSMTQSFQSSLQGC